jgi:hypothetical protein
MPSPSPSSGHAHGRRSDPGTWSTTTCSGKAPTLARMGGASVPAFVDGRSFLSLAKDPNTTWPRTAILSEKEINLEPPNVWDMLRMGSAITPATTTATPPTIRIRRSTTTRALTPTRCTTPSACPLPTLRRSAARFGDPGLLRGSSERPLHLRWTVVSYGRECPASTVGNRSMSC